MSLMERRYAGLTVELHYSPNEREPVSLYVQCGDDEPVEAPVPAARALDAFWHPFAYVNPPRALLSPCARGTVPA